MMVAAHLPAVSHAWGLPHVLAPLPPQVSADTLKGGNEAHPMGTPFAQKGLIAVAAAAGLPVGDSKPARLSSEPLLLHEQHSAGPPAQVRRGPCMPLAVQRRLAPALALGLLRGSRGAARAALRTAGSRKAPCTLTHALWQMD